MSLHTLFEKWQSTDFHIYMHLWKVMHEIIAEWWKNSCRPKTSCILVDPCRYHNFFWDDSFGQLLTLLLFCFLSEYVFRSIWKQWPCIKFLLLGSILCESTGRACQAGPVLFIWALIFFYPSWGTLQIQIQFVKQSSNPTLEQINVFIQKETLEISSPFGICLRLFWPSKGTVEDDKTWCQKGNKY